MNYRAVFNIIGKVVGTVAVFMLPALIISLALGERSGAVSFAVSIAICAVVALPLAFLKPKRTDIFAREGMVTVGLAWVFVSLLGALPFLISGAIPKYIDCVFETASGFTTTGATILTEIEHLPRGILYWRSFTHWLGGMGVLVFLLILNPLSDKNTGEGMHLLRAESPGIKASKLMPRMKDSARILYLIYIFLTVLEIVLLLPGRMPVFDAVCLAFGTAGTGGFGVLNDSVASYNPYCQWVITVFMLLFAVNFNVYFLLLVRKFKKALKNEELITFALIVLASIVIISINIFRYFSGVGETVRAAAFQVASIISTTGFTTVNFDLWPQLSRTILVALMFCGACAGSTGGGAKVIRIIISFKAARRSIYKTMHPNSVRIVHVDGERIDDATVSAVGAYMLAYLILFSAAVLLVSLDGMSFETNFTAVAACLNNIGPGLGGVGAVENYSAFSWFSKIVLALSMLIGRLEVYPILLLFTPSVWRKIQR